jgi:excisionase family DNA binding protein
MREVWPGYVTSNQAAIRLGLTRQRVSQILQEGLLPFKVLGTHRMIKVSDLEQFASIKRRPGPRKSPLDD